MFASNNGLSLTDVREYMELLRAATELWDDPVSWRRTVLRGARTLLAGNVGSMQSQRISASGRLEGPVDDVALSGIADRTEHDAHMHAARCEMSRSGSQTPGMDEFFDRFRRDGRVTANRESLTNDRAYYASASHRLYRKNVGCDDYIVSAREIENTGRFEVLTIDRPREAPRFAQRDVEILSLLHDELSRLTGSRLSTEAQTNRSGLSRRAQQILGALLDGHSEKEVARLLGISVTTTHDYVGLVYRHFRVHSRAELMAFYVRREPKAAS